MGVEVFRIDPGRKVITLSADEEMTCSPREQLCLFRKNELGACGEFLSYGPPGQMKMRSSLSGQRLYVGDIVTLRKPELPMGATNATLGINYLFPFVHVQQLISRNVSYGLMPMVIWFSQNGADLRAVAILATLNYHTRTYRGLWLRGGIGLHIAKIRLTNSTDGTTSLMILGTAGWRWMWPSGFNIAASAGAQYFFDSKIKADLKFSGLLPALVLEVGFTFL